VGAMAPRLRDHGFEVSIAVLRVLNSPLEQRLKAVGIPVLRTANAASYSPFHIRPLARLMEQHDLVHVHLFPAQLWAAAALRQCDRQPVLITTEHNPDNNRRGKPFARSLDRILYRSYDSVVCNSEATAAAMLEWVPQVHDRLTVIPNGIAVERFRSAVAADRDMIVHGHRGPIAIFVARLQPQKDHETLLRAIARIPDVQLLLVGEGELRSELEQLAGALGIATRVHFLGQRADVAELLKMADLYIHATHSDGFGIAALEAMAAGLPVIASNVPGLAEVVGNAGILVPPRDAEALARAIQSVLSDPALKAKLASAAAARASSFDISQTIAKHVDLYQRLLTASTAIAHATAEPERAANARAV
jgi:glycosyltransferase involved in cell wall biosynthesis